MEQKVSFHNSKGQKLVGILHIPEGEGPFPAVLVLHGFRAFKEHPPIVECSEALCAAGFVALRFDASNSGGESDGDVFDCSLIGYLDDINCALGLLETSRYVDKDRLGITGHSLGGQALLITAARDRRVKVIATLSSAFRITMPKLFLNMDESEEKGYDVFRSFLNGRDIKLGYHFCKDFLQYGDEQMRTIVSTIGVPTRVIHSEKDEFVPIEIAHELFDTLNCEKDFHLIKDAPHTWEDPAQLEEVATLVVEWFEKHLK